MSRLVKVGRLYFSWGRIPAHHHFAKKDEVWTHKYKPSQPRPVKWQLVRANPWQKLIPLIWILWMYPKDGSAIHFEFGLSRQSELTLYEWLFPPVLTRRRKVVINLIMLGVTIFAAWLGQWTP